MKNKIRISIAVAIVALIASGLFTHGFGLWEKPRDNVLKLYGNVDIREVNLGFRVGGRIAEMPYEEGVHVEKGALLAKLDTRPLDNVLASATAKLASAAAALAKLRAGNRPQEIAAAVDESAKQSATMVNARSVYDRSKKLRPSGIETQEALEAKKAMFDAAEASAQSADQALSLQRAGYRQEDIDAGKAQFEMAEADVATAQTDLDDARLLSPDAGVLLTRAREPGAIVAGGETVFTLTIENPMRIRAYIAEPDLHRIQPGLEVSVSTISGGKTYHGTIGYISPTAEFTPKSVETENLRVDLVYRLRVIVTDPDNGLRQGQPVTVYVPSAAPARVK